MANPTIYTFHADPDHAWLQVSLAELYRLGLCLSISKYSYQKGDQVFLEEDCDAPKFLLAKEIAGEPYKTVEVYEANTPVRAYAKYVHHEFGAAA